MQTTEQPRSLKHRTFLLLKASPLSYREIAKKIDVTPTWVRMFADEEIKNPGVTTIQRLYELLANEPLFKD
jgi:transcriptional regulator with XRE-family HTH domain